MKVFRVLFVYLLFLVSWCSAFAQSQSQRTEWENGKSMGTAPLDVAEKVCLKGNNSACARVVILAVDENKTSSVLDSARKTLSSSCGKDVYCTYYADLLRLGLGGARDYTGAARAYKKACDSYKSLYKGINGNEDPSMKIVMMFSKAYGSVDLNRESDCTRANQLSRYIPKPKPQTTKKPTPTTNTPAQRNAAALSPPRTDKASCVQSRLIGESPGTIIVDWNWDTHVIGDRVGVKEYKNVCDQNTVLKVSQSSGFGSKTFTLAPNEVARITCTTTYTEGVFGQRVPWATTCERTS